MKTTTNPGNARVIVKSHLRRVPSGETHIRLVHGKTVTIEGGGVIKPLPESAEHWLAKEDHFTVVLYGLEFYVPYSDARVTYRAFKRGEKFSYEIAELVVPDPTRS